MRILFISAILPYPLYSGGQVRIYNLLKHLSARHEITLLTFIRQQSEIQQLNHLSFLKRIQTYWRGRRIQLRYLVKSQLRRISWLTASYDHSGLKSDVGRFVTSGAFDLVHIEPFYVYRSLPPLPVPLVVAEHNVEYQVYSRFAQTTRNALLRYFIRQEAAKIEYEEMQSLAKSAAVIAVSREDRERLLHLTSAPVHIVPNGVDTEFFRFYPAAKPENLIKLLFVGNLKWLPNQEALTQLLNRIWPVIKQEVRMPVRLRIIGQGAKKILNNDHFIEYADSVPDIRNEYKKCHALIAPMGISGGSKFKILEAMASGTPIITSKAGISGLSVNETHVGIAHGVTGYARLVASIHTHSSLWQQKIRAARALVEHDYEWKPISEKMSAIWDNLK